MTKADNNGKEVVFFIDNEQFKTEESELTVRIILTDYAKEDPAETVLVHRKGNDLTKLEDLDQIIVLENGMKFVVYHTGPTPVSWRG